MPAITVHIPEQVLARLQDLAFNSGSGLDELVGEALEMWLSCQESHMERTRQGLAQARRGEVASREEVRQAFLAWGFDCDAES